jgi:hypothetical protein
MVMVVLNLVDFPPFSGGGGGVKVTSQAAAACEKREKEGS